jgi:hypothetical protein
MRDACRIRLELAMMSTQISAKNYLLRLQVLHPVAQNISNDRCYMSLSKLV